MVYVSDMMIRMFIRSAVSSSFVLNIVLREHLKPAKLNCTGRGPR